MLRSEIKANRVNMTGTEPQGVIAVELQEDNGSSFGGGWKALGNDVTLQQGGIGFLYRHGSTGALNSNKVFNVNTAQNFRAMHMEYDHYSEASENTIDQTAPGGGFGSSQGITVNGCFLNDFECNCISHVGYGTDFYDINNSTNIKGNRYFSYNTGLVVGSAQRPDTYIGQQIHHGNWWDIPSGILGARHFSSDFQILDKSKFVVASSQNAGFLPTRVPGTGWFFPQINEGQTFACERPCTSSIPMVTTPTAVQRTAPDELDEAVALDAMPTDSFPGSMNWKGAYRLYRNLLQHPEWLAYSPIYQNFKDQHAAGPVGILAYVAEQRAALFDVGEEPVDLINTLAEQAAAIVALDSLRQAGGTVDSLEYQSLVAEYAATQADYNDLLADWRDDRAGQISTLLILNAAVSDTSVWVQNHKAVNHILLTATLEEEITTGQLDTLTDIANQCPLLGGDAVYEARSVVSYLTGVSFDDDSLCQQAAANRSATPEAARQLGSSVVLFPNPTTGKVYWFGLQGRLVDVKVYDRLGRLMLERNTDEPSLDLSALPSGTYRVSIFEAGRLPVYRNIVLQRPE
ncbi:MAG: T9SS type A sorting domain-containing protein [Saprospiraceae bacterium]